MLCYLLSTSLCGYINQIIFGEFDLKPIFARLQLGIIKDQVYETKSLFYYCGFIAKCLFIL